MKSTLILLLVFITFFTFSVTAQHSYIPTERTFTTKDGLLSNKIHAIHKDARGFMWIGTENGLNRFDGQNVESYTTASHPKMNIEHIHAIAEDGAGYLWLLERNETFERRYASPEINLFNIYTGEFTTLEERFGKDLPFKVEQIWHMQQLSDGSIFIFVCLQQKAYFYTEKDGFVSMPIPKRMGLMGDVEILKDNNILIEGAFSDYEAKNIRWSIFKFNKKGKLLLERPSQLVIPIKDNNQTQYWNLEENRQKVSSGLLDAIQVFDPKMNIPYSKSNSVVESMDYTAWNKDQKLLWLKSQQNIRVIQPSGKIVYERQVNMDIGELPIFFDGTTTWFSNKQQGLFIVTLQPNYFKTYQFFDNEYENSARGIFAHTNGKKWFSTYTGVKKLDANNQSSLVSHPFTTPFLKGQSNLLWSFDKEIVTSEDLTTHQKQSYPNEPYRLHNWSLYQSENGEIWNFALTAELFILNPTEAKWRKQSKLPITIGEGDAFNAYHIQRKDAQSIWICSNHGLFVVDNEGNYIAQYGNHQKGEFYLPALDFHHMHQDAKGTIWLATGDGGLISWQSAVGSEQSYKQYTVDDGLTCNALHAVYEDDYEYLWISSNDGLMQMDKHTGRVITYTTENGLLHNEFNRISHFQAEDGMLYLGSVAGIIAFYPKDYSKVRHQKNNAQLVVTDFQQFSGKRGQFENLTYQLLEKSSIRLRPNDRFFKLNLRLLSYEDGTIFKYRIKGLYDWQTTTNTELSISGLPYGTNQLEIKAFNSQQQEAANMLTIPIRVLRPFYLQWWFIVLVLGMLGTGIFYFVKWRTQQLLVFQETEQLRSLDKMKSRFFANLSHELRTPITLILAPLTELIKNHTQQSAELTTQQLLNIKSNGQNLLNLVNEVLDLSKLEADKLELHLVPTKIPQFIERVVANFESAASIKGIEYQMMSFLQKDITALFDQQKLEKILNNLLSNALKFTPKNGNIQIMVAQVEQDLVIKVKDSGRGISAEDLPHIFDRYFQTTTKNVEGGTGIGLALTKELVELMNGGISVKSELGEGTEFEVKLPIALVTSDEIVLEAPVSNLVGFENLRGFAPETSTDKKDTILLVEDNPSLQQFIQSVLAPHYNVIVTGNGVEALEQLTIQQSNNSTINTILSDVMMPEMDGFTLLEKVKSDDRFCSIPFILLTARADMKDKLRGLRIGVDDYMTKPFEVDELLLRIKNLIANSKNRVIEEIQEVKPKGKSEVKEQKTTKQPVTNSSHEARPSNHQSLVTNHDMQWLEQVENIIKRELRNKQLKMEDIAQEVFLSRRQLGRRIKQITGLSSSAYMRSVRLQVAKNILETEDNYTISEVSYSVGFENPSYFSKIYQEAYGKHPQDYLIKI
jgi:signal transduction histidine kinase/DNA-binding response OmpR family regulator/streptogramin lyase